MTPENFVYWLQGFFEISNTNKLTEQQVEMIKAHLALVLENKTHKFVFDTIQHLTC